MGKLMCNPSGIFVVTMMLLCMTASQNNDNFPTILGGIENVANTATNFLSGIMRQQKRLIDRVTDTATEYITSAVERPRNLLINATRATTGYIDSAASRGLEFKLRRFLEKLRTRMPYGIPDLGIPPMEPLQLDEIDIEIDNQEIGKYVIECFGHLQLRTAEAPVRSLTRCTSNLMFKLLPTSLTALMQMQNRRRIQFATRLYAQVFQELLPKALDIVKPEILPPIKSYIGGKINETIQHLTMRDIISVLVGPSEIREFAHLLVP
ncbi:uncharacterized protein LOC108625785 [Ceratina calcarata]|uniref:Uncharacterized protein LOC108625785 n=1 Tax=Ceratina calcarata TaxID=156304 RepID=A0AAJ7S2C0_9HYME|nr:uncharacterized protein LOC108625785 [Ceratina calcarata]